MASVMNDERELQEGYRNEGSINELEPERLNDEEQPEG
jgi:hypothetical protein